MLLSHTCCLHLFCHEGANRLQNTPWIFRLFRNHLRFALCILAFVTIQQNVRRKEPRSTVAIHVILFNENWYLPVLFPVPRIGLYLLPCETTDCRLQSFRQSPVNINWKINELSEMHGDWNIYSSSGPSAETMLSPFTHPINNPFTLFVFVDP